MHEDIFDNASLVQFSTRVWQGQKSVEPRFMRPVGDEEWVKGRKSLVDPEYLAPIRAVVARARALLRKQALPFPLESLTLVPKEAITTIEAGLTSVREDFWREVAAFESRYAQAREEAQAVLGMLFSEADYPQHILDRFGFEWRYVQLGVPGRTSLLSAELFERERRKFVALMDTARSEAMLALREEFAGLVGHLTERLTDDGDRPKVLRASMVEKLGEFLDSFSTRNLFQDESLAELVAQARGLTSGVDIEALRSDGFLRSRVKGEMERIKNAVDAAIEDLPRRRILMAA